MTVSVGVGTAEDAMNIDLGDFLAAVDRALYAAKRGGRNQVVLADRAEFEPRARKAAPIAAGGGRR